MVSWAHIQNQRHMNFQKITLKTKIYSQSPKDPPPPIWSFSSSSFVIWPFGANMICEMKKSSRHWRFWITKQGDENDQIGGGLTFLGVRLPASLIKWGGEPVYIQPGLPPWSSIGWIWSGFGGWGDLCVLSGHKYQYDQPLIKARRCTWGQVEYKGRRKGRWPQICLLPVWGLSRKE